MSGEEESKNRGVVVGHQHESYESSPSADPPQYGTFQGVPAYPPPLPPQHHQRHQPAMGFPQPVPPPGVSQPSGPPADYYAHGYQAVPGYAVAEGRPVREGRLPCCGIGVGWFLFIIGFVLAAIPWYVGALVLLCSRSLDYREKPGYIGCTVAAILATVAIIFGVTKSADDW